MSEIDHTGACLQENMRVNPARQSMSEQFYTKRGTIGSVRFQDHPEHPRFTVVDVIMEGFPLLVNVPVLSPKINKNNGEEWTPEPGDWVLVSFIDGNFYQPFVMGYLPTINNEIQATVEAVPFGKRRYHMRCNDTDVVIDKDGNRITYIAGNQDEEVEGNDTLIVHGNVTIHVFGTATVNVDGNTTITTPNATVHASGQVTLDTPLTACTGNLQVAGGITSTGTYGSSGGKITTPGDIKSTNGEVGDKIRNISGDRSIYNGHNHSNNGTSVPNQQM